MNRWYIIVLILIIALGGYFRFQGIEKELSFWNDEIHTAYFSRAILEKGEPTTQHGHSTGLYQIGLYYVTSIAFSIFGVSEFAGRFPSVIVGTLLIYIVFIVTKKISTIYAAIIASTLTAFSQIQLAWSTQLRPYIWLEVFTLLIAYLGFCYVRSKKTIDRYLLLALMLSCISALFHGTGLINFLLIALLFLYKIFLTKKYHYLLLLFPVAMLAMGILYFSLSPINRNLNILLQYNFNLLHYRVFLQANYWWLLLGAGIGSIALLKKSVANMYIFVGFPIIIFLFAIFKINSQYVRYSLPAFPFLYILFGIGIVSTIQYVTASANNYYVKRMCIIALMALTSIQIIKTGKVLTVPRYYYTINGDMRENPIVDYKTAFKKIAVLAKQQKKVVVLDAWNDRVPWFMPNQPYIFLIEHRPAKIDPVFGEPMVATIDEFLQVMKQYPAGIILVENWESQTAYNLQQYIRNNLTHRFNVENLPYNEADKWSISIYSWGLPAGR